jgi:hypothetical protein
VQNRSEAVAGYAAANFGSSTPVSNTLPETHMRCMITAGLRVYRCQPACCLCRPASARRSDLVIHSNVQEHLRNQCDQAKGNAKPAPKPSTWLSAASDVAASRSWRTWRHERQSHLDRARLEDDLGRPWRRRAANPEAENCSDGRRRAGDKGHHLRRLPERLLLVEVQVWGRDRHLEIEFCPLTAQSSRYGWNTPPLESSTRRSDSI